MPPSRSQKDLPIGSRLAASSHPPVAIEAGARQAKIDPPGAAPLNTAGVARFWFPLALMWWMMSAEHTILAAFIARMPDSEVNLAAYGLAFSLALIVESPVIMLLTAGTALATDAAAYRKLFRFTALLALVLTIIHVWLALDARVYTFILVSLIGAPEALAEPSRLAFLGMSAWTAAIAFRRLWQGVMIRFDRPRAASVTTVFRIAALAIACWSALHWGRLPGAFAGGLALSAGVLAGVVAAGIFVWPTIRGPLASAGTPSASAPSDLSYLHLLSFYLPLALTSFIVLAAQPVLSVGLSWAPDAMTALAVWPVLSAIVFMARSGGVAYQEVVVALIVRPGGEEALRRFTGLLALALSGALLVLAWSPLGDFWLREITDLSEPLARAAIAPLRILAPAPAATVMVSWYRGRLVGARRTKAITRAVFVNLFVLLGSVAFGIRSGLELPGATLAATALCLSLIAEVWVLRSSLRLASPVTTRP